MFGEHETYLNNVSFQSLASFSWRAEGMWVEFTYIFPLCVGDKAEINFPNSCWWPVADGVILI